MKHARRFFDVSLEACRRVGRRALLLSHFPEQTPSPLPASAAYFEYAPLSEVLHRSAALIYHGGIGAAAQALRAGIPHLISPFSYDQPDNAARLKALGVAAKLYPAFFTPGRAAAKLENLLSSKKVEESCRRIARQVQPASAIEATCRLIEGLRAF